MQTYYALFLLVSLFHVISSVVCFNARIDFSFVYLSYPATLLIPKVNVSRGSATYMSMTHYYNLLPQGHYLNELGSCACWISQHQL